MAKHLIYLGYTGTAHRIALFDEANILAVKLPVKDVTVLSDDLVFLNCTVVAGKPVPNLMGAKVLMSVKDSWKCSKDDSLFDFGYSKKGYFNPRDLWAFEGKVPDYFYGTDLGKNEFHAGQLLWKHRFLKVWDGVCAPENMYVIGDILRKSAKERNKSIGCNLCLSSEGDVLFLSESGTTMLVNNGAVFVQVGTPTLACTNAFSMSDKSIVDTAVVSMAESLDAQVIWLRRVLRNKPEVYHTAEFIWWSKICEVAVEDLRRYPKARVFGLNTVGDARVVIYPEGTESIWLASLNSCRHLTKLYIPSSLKHLVEVGFKSRALRDAVVYTNSECMIDLCARYGVEAVSCSSADAMLEGHYKAYSEDFLDATDASNLASLGGVHSARVGGSGTLWSAVRFSAADRSMANTELQSRYLVTPTCDLDIPEDTVVNAPIILVDTDYARELSRLMVSAFTQFYPYSARKVKCPDKIYRTQLGDYTLYQMIDVFAREKIEAWSRDSAKVYHMFLVANSAGRVIHRFVGTDMVCVALHNLGSLCLKSALPSGVLRYADKLPRVRNTTGSTNFFKADEDEVFFAKAVFTSLLPVMFGTARKRRELVGIDLNTGNLVSMEYTPNFSSAASYLPPHSAVGSEVLLGIWNMSRIKVYAEDSDASDLFESTCQYRNR